MIEATFDGRTRYRMLETLRMYGLDRLAAAGETDAATGRMLAWAVELTTWADTAMTDLARSSGATFIVGVATLGLLAVRAKTGRIYDALCGYRDVIDYFARTGNWTHQWATLRNLAGLLYHLGDHDPAMQLHAAADQAPEAPAVNPLTSDTKAAPGVTPAANRARALEVARQAIERHLAGS